MAAGTAAQRGAVLVLLLRDHQPARVRVNRNPDGTVTVKHEILWMIFVRRRLSKSANRQVSTPSSTA